MKKTKVKLLLLLVAVVAVALILAACNGGDDSASEQNPAIRGVYDLYVENMNATNQTPLTYELWLSMIRGEDGKDGEDGKTPFIGGNGNWWIGETDTGVRAAGRDGTNGQNGQHGMNGTNGTNGKDGRGVLLMEIIDGDLWVFYTDGTSANLGSLTPPTTTTTAPAGGQIPQEDLDKISFKNLPDEIPYDGNPLNSSDVGVGKPSFLNASYKFEKINPADGSVIADLGSTYPTDVGTYKITATFSWRDGAEEMYPGADLPAAVSDTFQIVAGDANRASAFGVKALSLFYYPEMKYYPATATGTEQFTTGTLPKNVTIAGATIEKLASADATSGTAVAGAKITEAGIYKVTINYAQNGENWSASSLAGKSAVITVIECPNQVLRNDNVVVDGLLGDEYTGSAVLTGKKQLYTQTSNVYTLTPDENGQIVDPMKFIPMLSINHGSQAGEKSEGSKLDVSVHVVWGANGTKGDYVYVAVVVEDPTDCMRSEQYTRTLNPWVNDGIEVYYNFGGYSAPVIKKNASSSYGDTYPVYSAVVNDSAARPGAEPTAVDLQMSFYWNDIEFASTRTTDGNGGVTYICEYAFPAKSEGDNGMPVGPQFTKTKGEALTVGEFLFFAFQFNDLVALDTVQNPLAGAETVGDAGYKYDAIFPSGAKYPNYAIDYKLTMVKDGDWDKFEAALAPYMALYGNRSNWYLMHDQGGPSCFQLSADVVQ